MRCLISQLYEADHPFSFPPDPTSIYSSSKLQSHPTCPLSSPLTCLSFSPTVAEPAPTADPDPTTVTAEVTPICAVAIGQMTDVVRRLADVHPLLLGVTTVIRATTEPLLTDRRVVMWTETIDVDPAPGLLHLDGTFDPVQLLLDLIPMRRG